MYCLFEQRKKQCWVLVLQRYNIEQTENWFTTQSTANTEQANQNELTKDIICYRKGIQK